MKARTGECEPQIRFELTFRTVALLRIAEGIDHGRGVMPRYFDHMPATKTKRPPDRPTVLSLTVKVDALDFALAV